MFHTTLANANRRGRAETLKDIHVFALLGSDRDALSKSGMLRVIQQLSTPKM